MPARKADALTAEHWRMRAERARKVAESMPDMRVRKMMEDIARDYEALAARAEEKKTKSELTHHILNQKF